MCEKTYFMMINNNFRGKRVSLAATNQLSSICYLTFDTKGMFENKLKATQVVCGRLGQYSCQDQCESNVHSRVNTDSCFFFKGKLRLMKNTDSHYQILKLGRKKSVFHYVYLLIKKDILELLRL